MTQWDFWIDRGGTFTDIVARDPDGNLHTRKYLSENPEQYEDAALQCIRDFLNLSSSAPIPSDRIASVKMGTTVATNALLERKGERTLLVTTKGLRDQLRLAYQNRPKLFDREIILPEQLYTSVIEANERIQADGNVLIKLDKPQLLKNLHDKKENGYDSCAIVFAHGYRYQSHELAAGKLAKQAGFSQVSISHEVSPLMKMVSRGDTTVVDAYLTPILRRYVDRVAAAFSGEIKGKLMFMMSSGGLTDASLFQGKDAILSGPAGGVVGAVETSKLAGFDKIIGFDMGGTSTDVCHYDNALERVLHTEIAGVRMRAPMMRIHTVAAGGGSLLGFDGQRMRVGPESAGADPGPTCYGKDGPLTVTDANVLTGRLKPEFFPAIFGPNADQPLDYTATAKKFAILAREIGISPEEAAEGFLKIAAESMASAIKKISVQRGYDVTEYCLTVFGGAGSQFACSIADILGMDNCLVHPMASLLSAYGMGLADIRAHRQHALETDFTQENLLESAAILDQLGSEASQEISRQGVKAPNITAILHLKVTGTDTTLDIPYGNFNEVRAIFDQQHIQRFGYSAESYDLVIEAVSVEAVGKAADLTEQTHTINEYDEKAILATKSAIYAKGWQEARFIKRSNLKPGAKVTGPAVIIEDHTSIVIEAGWQARITGYDHVVLKRIMARPHAHAIGTKADPILLEVFNNLYMSIAEQMGAVLENTARSITIKERLDFSCAVFDAKGDLIANAPHIPVHLGSMNASVQTIIKQNPDMQPGDVYMLNAPYNGGTHLPDITVVMPVWSEDNTDVLFYTAARGHHTDVGGLTPGSMPPDSRVITEEGIYIDNFKLIDKGTLKEQEVRELLASGEYPCRNIDVNIADLKAHIASCQKGADELRNMVQHFSLDVVKAYMNHVQDNAEECVRRAIPNLSNGKYIYHMDDGYDGGKRAIHVKLSVDKKAREVTIDFTGTTAQLSNNYNAPQPVTRAACLYVFRCLVNDDIPMNEGVMKPLNIILPKGTMLSPQYPAAVIAGNVETSQAVTNALFLSLGVMAASQGTMNNTTWGNDTYQYYETVCGGSGAGWIGDPSEPDRRGHNGTDGVQTHMTNSRLTDPEVLEWRYPVLLEEFSLRDGSGGKGKYSGGNGITRRIRFLEEMTVSILSGHRQVPPPGLDDGEAGSCGSTRVIRADGTTEILGSADRRDMNKGDIFLLETPGGGGCGKS